jgi:membrane-bound lytic murein transglycosylase
LADLRGGFGEKIGQYFQTKREHITAAAIKEICASNPQEIDNILDQIESLL